MAIVAVDGFIKMMNRHPQFDGIQFEMEERSDPEGAAVPFACNAKLYLKGRAHPVSVTEYFSECVRDTDPWRMMPRRMLRNRALCQAARIAFGFSGVKDEDEAVDDIIAESEPLKLPENPELKPSEPKSNNSFKMSMDPPRGDGINITQSVPIPTIHEEFQKFLDEHSISFDVFQKWGEESGNIPDASSKASIEEVDGKTLVRLLKAKKGLLTSLEQIARPT